MFSKFSGGIFYTDASMFKCIFCRHHYTDSYEEVLSRWYPWFI